MLSRLPPLTPPTASDKANRMFGKNVEQTDAVWQMNFIERPASSPLAKFMQGVEQPGKWFLRCSAALSQFCLGAPYVGEIEDLFGPNFTIVMLCEE